MFFLSNLLTAQLQIRHFPANYFISEKKVECGGGRGRSNSWTHYIIQTSIIDKFRLLTLQNYNYLRSIKLWPQQCSAHKPTKIKLRIFSLHIFLATLQPYPFRDMIVKKVSLTLKVTRSCQLSYVSWKPNFLLY